MEEKKLEFNYMLIFQLKKMRPEGARIGGLKEKD